ncbi:hypothetical protein [Brevundimonas sp. Leaf168]|uniref:hypothetical protein n=1 Tax=Brevundimonas sp. Leaf168 TaxID=1736283 RepID=UPI0006FB168E|nr:hypothetical protein [Brevundimonas sp. Leaf168]KQR57209.1 hypothetical protein ASF81_06565 [Brevundimonas sp. Leaf168]
MMGRFLLLLILCVALAVLRAVIVATVALVVLALIVSFITRPRQTLVFVGTLALSALTVTQPLACIITLAALGFVIAFSGRKRRHSKSRYLDPPHP